MIPHVEDTIQLSTNARGNMQPPVQTDQHTNNVSKVADTHQLREVNRQGADATALDLLA